MSRENVEVVERAYVALNEHDVEGFVSLCDARVEYVNPPYATEPGVRSGHRAIVSILRSLFESFDGYQVQPQRLEPVGSKVLVIGRPSGRGRSSGAEFEALHGYVITLDDRKIMRFEWFREPQEALEAVGLSE